MVGSRGWKTSRRLRLHCTLCLLYLLQIGAYQRVAMASSAAHPAGPHLRSAVPFLPSFVFLLVVVCRSRLVRRWPWPAQQHPQLAHPAECGCLSEAAPRQRQLPARDAFRARVRGFNPQQQHGRRNPVAGQIRSREGGGTRAQQQWGDVGLCRVCCGCVWAAEGVQGVWMYARLPWGRYEGLPCPEGCVAGYTAWSAVCPAGAQWSWQDHHDQLPHRWVTNYRSCQVY